MFGILGRLRPRLEQGLGFDPVVFVDLLYTHFVHRKARAPEIAYQVARLAAGLDPNDLLRQFARHQEEGGHPIPLYVPLGHHCSPMVDPVEISERFRNQTLPDAIPGIAIDTARHERLWQKFRSTFADQPFSSAPTPGLRFHFDNPSFGPGDGLLYYAMLRHLRPRRVIEIGSGYTSGLLLDVVERFLQGQTQCTFIEPHPELVKSLLSASDIERHRLIVKPVQDVPLDVFRELGEGDILFIDSSHLMKTCSDTNYELFEILPALHPGVHIHIHDIFYPFEYPADWVLTENRSWNEAYALRAFLMFNPLFEVDFFNDYFGRFCRPLIDADQPLWGTNTGGSIWLHKKPAAAL